MRIGLVRNHSGHRPNSVGIRLDTSVIVPRVSEIRAGSPAERAGVQIGDSVIAVDGRDVSALPPDAVLLFIGDREVGALVEITFARDGVAMPRTLAVEPPWDP